MSLHGGNREDRVEDLDQVRQAFLHDSGAMLTDMAAGLALGVSLHEACRSVHAIRGGGAAFGLDALAEAAHRLETVFVLADDGEIEASAEVVALMERGVGLLRNMVRQAADAGDAPSSSQGAEVLRALTLLAADENINTSAPGLGHDDRDVMGDCQPMDNEEEGARRRFLTVAVEAETFGVDLRAVRKVARWTEVADLPVIDMRALCGLGATLAGARHPVVIVDASGRCVALLVDAVPDILTVGPDDIEDEAAGESWRSGRIIVGQRQTPLLALDRLCDANPVGPC